jgi:solute carrier family 25 2-oxodicarboxylate transporter 21
MVYFGFYHSVKDFVPQFTDPTAEFCRKVITNYDTKYELNPLILLILIIFLFKLQFAFGLVAGTIASCVNIPFDVAKSRIQGPQPQIASDIFTKEAIRKITYKQTFVTIVQIYKKEG